MAKLERLENFLNVDYLSVTKPVTVSYQPHELLDTMMNIVNLHSRIVEDGCIAYSERGINCYQKSFTVPKFFSIYYDNVNKQNDSMMLLMSGEGLGRMSEEQLDAIREYLYQNGYHCTRIDFAFTDFTHDMPVEELMDDFESWGRLDCDIRIRTKKQRTTMRMFYNHTKTGVSRGMVLGSRKSDCYVRLYDKRLENKMDVPYCYRLEYELHRDDAQRYFESWASGQMTVGNVMVELLATIFTPVTKIDVNISHALPRDYWTCFLIKMAQNINDYGRARQKHYFATFKSAQSINRFAERISATFYTYIAMNHGDVTQLLELGKVRAERNLFYRQLIRESEASA